MTKRIWAWSILATLVVVGACISFAIAWPRHLFAQAKEAAARQQWGEADQHLKKLLAWRPNDATALELMAQVAEARGDLADAVSFLARVPPDSPRAAQLWTRQGVLLLSLHQGPEAEQVLRRAIERNPKLDEAAWHLAWYCGVTQREREATDLLWHVYGNTLRAEQRLFTLRRLVALRPGLDLGEHVSFIAQCAENSPQDFHIILALGSAYSLTGRTAEAAKLLASCVQSEPEHPVARRALAETYLKLGQVAAAEETLRPLVDQAVAFPDVWFVQGQIAEEQNNWSSAQEAYERALAHGATDRQTHYRLSIVLEQLGKSEAASEHRDIAWRLHQTRYELLGVADIFDQEMRAGVTPTLVPKLFQLGSLCEDLGWMAEALGWYREVLAVAPAHGEARRKFEQLARVVPQRNLAPSKTDITTHPPSPVLWDATALTKQLDGPTSGHPIFQFDEIAAEAGIDFRYSNGAQGLFALRETMGAGVATLDFNADGRMDIFLINSGTDQVGEEEGRKRMSQLVRNTGSRSFQDVTGVSGLTISGYFQGCAAADFDNDGFVDLYLSGYRTHRLFGNNGDGTFRDVTESLGRVPQRWGTSCAFGDLSGDGNLDLYVATYVKDDPTRPSPCKNQLGNLVYCEPHRFEAEPDLLFVNQGDGIFQEVSHELGIAEAGGKGLGVVIADLNDDRRPDIFVANDTTPNLLFLNAGDGQFVEEGMTRGAALGGDGRARAGMGIACGDIANRGSLDLVITNFIHEPNTLLWNLGAGYFHDRGPQAGLAGPSFLQLGFATLLVDCDNDGWLDLFVSNGHINRDATGRLSQAMPPQLFVNERNGRFHETTQDAGRYFRSSYIGRGAAAADLNNDGRMDLVVTHQDQPPAVLLNELSGAGDCLELQLVGRASNRTALGTRVRAIIGAVQIMREVVGGGSYLSSSDPRVLIGLGSRDSADRLEVTWPSGETQSFGALSAGGWIVREGLAPMRQSNN